ncbi:grasp-with-spasm system ATP-grasp peptide maturase [Fulvivirgaceae bacterium BMA12]|uniref:Grasp-with-spasm system ATP-grasp peptide maturase n=1 Tax=Agaribacillus aureus TaxID=3051825 RepID=A0ABT8L3J2_9BACT|nr:grasp-with-spasm system ATP-grasp peptide maturase [Fulvivirgaceae bacterium BMA12]
MILIITNGEDISALHVMEWINWSKGQFEVMKGDYTLRNTPFSYLLNNEETTINLKNKPLNKVKPNVVFYRRWKSKPYYAGNHSFDPIADNELNTDIARHIENEQLYSDCGFVALLEDAHWLGNFGFRKSEDKIKVLICARQLGISIPPTLVTTQKSELSQFHKEQGTLITKGIHNVTIFSHQDTRYMMYTQEINKTDIEKLPDLFYPSLFQKQIKKELELRIFYLEPEFYAMAIFSQANDQTAVDFRHYDYSKPNRKVPFRLPDKLKKKLKKLMEKLSLNTGSIDMILTTEGKFVFLEVNPIGQFGMTSFPCNYNLEKKIAEYLMKHDV